MSSRSICACVHLHRPEPRGSEPGGMLFSLDQVRGLAFLKGRSLEHVGRAKQEGMQMIGLIPAWRGRPLIPASVSWSLWEKASLGPGGPSDNGQPGLAGAGQRRRGIIASWADSKEELEPGKPDLGGSRSLRGLLWAGEGRAKPRARQKIRLRTSGRWILVGIFS